MEVAAFAVNLSSSLARKQRLAFGGNVPKSTLSPFSLRVLDVGSIGGAVGVLGDFVALDWESGSATDSASFSQEGSGESFPAFKSLRSRSLLSWIHRLRIFGGIFASGGSRMDDGDGETDGVREPPSDTLGIPLSVSRDFPLRSFFRGDGSVICTAGMPSVFSGLPPFNLA